MSTQSYTVSEAQKKMEYYCSYQERCHDEVVAKLQSMNMIPQAIDLIVVHLITHNFLNEERFAQSFARGKHRFKKWGRFRIESELKSRHISSYNITKALQEIPKEVYWTTFHELAEKHWESIKVQNLQQKRKKFCDFLLRKGYETSLIFEKMSDLEKGVKSEW